MSMTTTKTTETAYRISTHDYLIEQGGSVTCANPAGCRRDGHWTLTDQRFGSVEAARADLGPEGVDYDVPAVRIVKVAQVIVITETVTEVDTVDLTEGW